MTSDVKREERNRRQREYRRRTGNAATHRYERTPMGHLMRAYANARNRVTGLSKPHLYEGLDIMDRDEFYAWSLSDPGFLALYKQWALTGYSRKMAPTLHRVDPEEGYVLPNLMWTTQQAASSVARRGNQAVLQRLASLYAPND